MKKITCAAVAAILLAGSAILGFAAGKRSVKPVVGTTFYATIERKSADSIIAAGLEINDINSRGRFECRISDKTVLDWRYTDISLEDLDEGDLVAVTYTGEVLEISPAVINDVLRVQLLEDEK
ncbi:hypothetical protein GPL15_26425 [Clostridium sp. MCC353]|uniref:hypothetical protein n=1 Tax=Clostridium sp. MCC353 TaxID=2592646 RepID=UPI001C0325AA|nr:hypothetical protein [Clostridium sp. MCC353]MBT9780008.1 hypothetical protein [Clostridium sp. MCC353]